MKVTSVKIENFKSFAKENNRLDVENINTIIGKNESGKSNLIEAIGNLNFLGINNLNFFENRNKNIDDNSRPVISVVLQPYEHEKKIYTSDKETIFMFKDKNNIVYEGGFTEIITNNISFQEGRERLNVLKKQILISDMNINKSLEILIQNINEAENKLFIETVAINSLFLTLERETKYKEFVLLSKEIIKQLKKLYSILPKFLILKDINLNSKYTKIFLNDNTQSKEMLQNLLHILDMDLESVKKFWNLSSEDDRYNFTTEINNKIQKFMDKFNEFYKQEKVELKLTFNNDSLNFLVKTNKKYLNLSERSNGLKWYLNMYIQLVAKTKKTNIENYVVLLDEPGVFLHVNAQKMILELFEDFVSNNNQIIYTTQHPTMIYQECLHRTRLMIKDENGNTNIGNRYYSLPHKMEGKTETITPILNALGMKMSYNLSGVDSEKVNIITEGISDYNYLKVFFNQLECFNKYNIIPSTSVTNIHNIVSILIGWGYKYKILLDQDSEGRSQYYVLTQKLAVNPDDIVFADISKIPNNKTNTIEDLFSQNDKKDIGINEADYPKEKAYYSLEALKRFENGKFAYDRETVGNFNRLLENLIN